jgi:hypothetical protein
MDDENHPSKKHPFLYALLCGLQLTAMGLCVLVIQNMLLDSIKAPVPQCPLRAEAIQ